MISYLRGKPVQVIYNSSKVVLIIEVNHIAYEVNIPSSLGRKITGEEESVQIFTHLLLKEDQPILYGFSTAAERDLFRQLISVNGVGSQLGVALIDTLGLEDLVQAVVTGNVKFLTKTPGVGLKTAERLALELKAKLSQWQRQSGIQDSGKKLNLDRAILDDVEMTLLALGYTKEEIQQAISAISGDSQLLKNPNVEEWIKRAIFWLSNI